MLLLLMLLAVELSGQQPGLATKPATTLVRLENGVSITDGEYRDHLLASFGYSRLEELVLDRILEVEVGKLAQERIPVATRSALEDPDRVARDRRAERIRTEFGGDQVAFERFQAETGITATQTLAGIKLSVLREARMTALVQGGRSPDEKALRRLFDEQFGVDGRRVEVRHVFQSFGKVANEFRERRIDPPTARVEAIVKERMDGLMQEHGQGTAFEDLVAKGSDDPEARRKAMEPGQRAEAGRIVGYNYQHFGVELAEAVRAMKVGEVRGPVKTTHGYHIVKLDALVVTEFASVQAELLKQLGEQPPSLQELRLLREALLGKHRVKEALPR